MLLSELSKPNSFKLEYHDALSTKIWDVDTLKSEVYDALKKISIEFIKTLEIDNSAITDVIITGSLCNYNYTKYSDIDLHIVVDYELLCDDCEGFSISDCMNAKKALWNERHDITIYGLDVELYVQSVNDPITGNAGVYSLRKKAWLKRPVKETAIEYDEKMIVSKAKYIMFEIDDIIENKVSDSESIDKLKEKIRNMRKSGLERGGEYSLENLVFKMLRNNGYLDLLNDYKIEKKNTELSLK